MEGEEEGREERATGWKPCWREERDGERERSKPGKLLWKVLLFFMNTQVSQLTEKSVGFNA